MELKDCCRDEAAAWDVLTIKDKQLPLICSECGCKLTPIDSSTTSGIDTLNPGSYDEWICEPPDKVG